MCRKEGTPPAASRPLEELLRCPDCARPGMPHTCPCGYHAEDAGGVVNLLPSTLRSSPYSSSRPPLPLPPGGRATPGRPPRCPRLPPPRPRAPPPRRRERSRGEFGGGRRDIARRG